MGSTSRNLICGYLNLWVGQGCIFCEKLNSTFLLAQWTDICYFDSFLKKLSASQFKNGIVKYNFRIIKFRKTIKCPLDMTYKIPQHSSFQVFILNIF